MLITLKTLQQLTFKVNIDEEETVRELQTFRAVGVGVGYVLETTGFSLGGGSVCKYQMII